MIGQRFGSFHVHSMLGAGGMGEVYRARDSKLGREVALKVLPAKFTADTDRLARFEREARLLATLNHPNIAAIYGLEEWASDEGLRSALILELVEGQTLAEWIATSRQAGSFGQPAAIALALNYTRQLAEALDAAHERGIVHRDLKPGNIKITPDGVVKVLDFGLAKALEGPGPTRSDGSSIDPAESPTAAAMTIDGQILGTPTYMSPEQARGRTVDKRTDIWAFGCVVYELLCGHAPFRGETISDTIAAVLAKEPDWNELPASTPKGVVRLLQRCLEKDSKRRLRDLGDVDLALEDGVAPSSVSAGPAAVRQGRGWMPLAVAAILALVSVAAWRLWPRAEPGPASVEPTRFEITPAVNFADSGQFAVSPDGRHLVFAGTGADGALRLWLRSFDTVETRPLLGTEADIVPIIPPMFWSPDSRSIGFYTGGKVRRVERAGGAPRALCEVPGVAVGGTWNQFGDMLVGNTDGGILRCPAAGGTATPVTVREGEIDHLVPSFLPDGRHFIYLRISRSSTVNNGLFLGDLAAPADAQPRDRIVETGFGGTYVPASAGRGLILFVRDRALMALPFDEEKLVAAGDAIPVVSAVGSFLDTAFFTASPNTLVFRGASPDYQLKWLDRRGAEAGLVGAPAEFVNFELSYDGTRVIAGRENRLNGADRDLWMVDVARNTTTRFTADLLMESEALWSRDSAQIYFTLGARRADVRVKPADGSRDARIVIDERTIGLQLNSQTTTMNMAPDDRSIVTAVESGTSGRFDLWLLPLLDQAKATPLVEQPFDQTDGRISADWRWLAYVSNESGANEVFVRPLSRDAATNRVTAGAAVLVSRSGGAAPRWRRDGKELFYLARSGAAMAVGIGAQIGEPAELFRPPAMLNDWDVSADGQRFLIATPTGLGAPALTVILNWRSGLKP
jgi:Tol biopolymer transport system component